ncbi:MAG: bifunctional UDP-N-acetylglucosamine diphosphorylase/glucosamine-1-phosphate N-acetyltransferase GlmU [Candidatus Pacebacteria bacterium]|nr:bifunctional UDP-N-acetylglucosamine diphosphorylase/glucosamine-1-phosphate N-acetyltransferase GlmU [Candidatus Paceibacterota bacterium]
MTKNQKSTTAVILAAGLGKRMKSERPKVLHEVAGQSMLAAVVAEVRAVGVGRIILVLGPEFPKAAIPSEVETVVQHNRQGTGDALRQAIPLLAGHPGAVVVLAGDVPLIRPSTIARLIEPLERDGLAIAVAGFTTDQPQGYGRLVLDDQNRLERIVEQKDATEAEQAIGLCNAGAYGFAAEYLPAWLQRLQPNNAQGEYYLTDCIKLARQDGLAVGVAHCAEAEMLGVNNRLDLARVEALAQQRLREAAMLAGVTLRQPETVTLSFDTEFAEDVIVEPFVVFGRGVRLARGVHIRSFSHLEGAVVAEGAIIGPYARLRPGTRIGAAAHVGNFVELKNSDLGAGAKANHLSYIGDTTVGEGANIGAGTITCNYDGFDKYRTEIGAGAFIGSNSSLVAPLRVGAGAIIGAGSVITAAVDADALAVTRAGLTLRPGWAARFREGKKGSMKKK